MVGPVVSRPLGGAPAAAPAPALPTLGIADREFRYRTSAKTDVSLTIEAERKRIGALTGAQVREARRKAERLAAERQAALADAIEAGVVTPIDVQPPHTKRSARP